MNRIKVVNGRLSGRWPARAAAAIVAGAVLFVPGAVILAHDDHDNDRGGASAALWQVIRHARVIVLSHTWDKNSPIASVNPPYSFELVSTHANTRGAFNDGDQLS